MRCEQCKIDCKESVRVCPVCGKPLQPAAIQETEAETATNRYRARMREASLQHQPKVEQPPRQSVQNRAPGAPQARIPRPDPVRPQKPASEGPAAQRLFVRQQEAEKARPSASRPLPPRKAASKEALKPVKPKKAPETLQPSMADQFNWIRLLVIALICVALLTGAVYFFLRGTDQGQLLLASMHMDARAEAYVTLGRQRMSEGAITQAVEALEIAQSKDPNNLQILMDLGAAYESNNRLDRAELAYRRAIQYNAAYPEPYRRIIDLFMETGREYEALQCMMLAYDKTKDEAFQDMLNSARPAYPRVSEVGGNFAKEFELTLTAPEGAEIRYTLDGTDPFLGKVYTGPIALKEGAWTLRAVSTIGNLVSEEQKQIYTVRRPAPDMPKETLQTGTYPSVRTVGLRAGEDVTAIYYTTDGSEPTVNSKVYKDPIMLRVGTTNIRAIAVNSIGKFSNELNIIYKCDGKLKNSMQEKDTFDKLTLFSTTREAFEKTYGKPQREEPGIKDALGEYQVLYYPFGYAVFLQRASAKNPVLAELVTHDSGMKGPRGVKVGMSLSDALALFRDEGGEDDGKGNRILYNLKGGSFDGNIGLLHRTGDHSHEVHYYCKVEKEYIELALYAENEVIQRVEWMRYRVPTE